MIIFTILSLLSSVASADVWGPPLSPFTNGRTIIINKPTQLGPAIWTAILDPNNVWFEDLWGIQGHTGGDLTKPDVMWRNDGGLNVTHGAICGPSFAGGTGTLIYRFEAESGCVFNGGTITADLIFVGTPSKQGLQPFAGISLAEHFELRTNGLGLTRGTWDNIYDVEQFLTQTTYGEYLETRTLDIPVGVSEFYLIFSDFNGYTTSAAALGYNSLSLSAYLISIPQECGDPGTVYIDTDINRDCYVDLKDFALLSANWLNSNDPNS